MSGAEAFVELENVASLVKHFRKEYIINKCICLDMKHQPKSLKTSSVLHKTCTFKTAVTKLYCQCLTTFVSLTKVFFFP